MNDVDRDEVEIGAIAAMTAAEVRAGLRQFGLRPIEHLPPELKRLRAARRNRAGVTTKSVEGLEETQDIVMTTPDGDTARKSPSGSAVWVRRQFQWLEIAWAAPRFMKVATVSITALFVVIGFAFGVRVAGARSAKPPAEPGLEGVTIINFPPTEEGSIRAAMRPKFTMRCSEAFSKSGLRSPLELAANEGVVIRPPSDLWLYPIDNLGLISNKTLQAYQTEFSSGRAQAGTVPATLDGVRLTTDGRPRIFLHGTVFYGTSFWFKGSSLSDVLTHEFIQVGRQPPTSGLMGIFQHDLAGFEHYKEIIEACR